MHRIDGNSHIGYMDTNKEEWKLMIEDIKNKKYRKLCYRCHKGVHFCMTFLKLDWNKIIQKMNV